MSLLVLFLSLFAFCTSLVAATAESFNKFISYDNEFLTPELLLSKSWNNSDGRTGDAQQTVIAWTDNLMGQGPWSVTYKSAAPPSGDMHDYLSWAPYYWPNCTGVGNKTQLTPQQIWTECPYVDRDGQFNPDYRLVNDSGGFAALADTVMYTTIAWTMTGNDDYASRAVLVLKTWFIDPATAMNPNLNYAQVIRGPGQQTGDHWGVLDLKNMAKVATGVLVLRKGNFSGWTPDLDSALVAWCKKYITWLETSPLGIGESQAPNNHGTFFFNQMVSLQIIVGNNTGAVDYLKRYFTTTYLAQINANGEQPLEAVRSRSYHYRAYNLGAMITNGKLGAYLQYDVWNITTTQGATIQTALDWAMQYNPATTDEVLSAPAQELYQHVAAVASVYGDLGNKYSTFLAGVNPTYPQDPYYMWDQPFGLPQNYVVTPGNGSDSNSTTPGTPKPNAAVRNGRVAGSAVLVTAILAGALLGLAIA